MKLNIKKAIFTGVLSTLFYANPSYGMDLEALLGDGGTAHAASRSESISSMVLSVYIMGDSEEMYGLFENGVAWSKLYRTQDNQDLKLSCTYTPREVNTVFMPRIQVIEEKYPTLMEHFMEQLSQVITPKILTHVEETTDGFNSKMKFLSKLPHTKEWNESIMKLPGFSPKELHQQFMAEKNQKELWKRELFTKINSIGLQPFTIQYSVPANPGLLKKYEGTNHGPIKFNTVTKEASKGKGAYSNELNYGVLTVTMEKSEPEGSYRPDNMPYNLENLMTDFDISLKNILETQKMYAEASYGKPRDNSGHMIH